MSKYTEWKLITESIAAGIPLGVRSPNTVGGLMGRLQESPVDLKDSGDDDEEDDEEEDEDDDSLDGDLNGRSKDDGIDPLKKFPPGDFGGGSGTAGGKGAPAPEGEDDFLADIDPDLAGLDDAGPMGAGAPPELGDAGGAPETGGELPPELANATPELGDEMGGELPPELGGMGDEMGGELPPELGGMGGEELPPELGDMGDEMGGEIPDGLEDMIGPDGAPDEGDVPPGMEPCPDCQGQADPNCETCGGEGFIPSPQGIDAEVEDQPAEGDKEAEMLQLMARMQDYCKKYMNESPMPQQPAVATQPGAAPDQVNRHYPPMQPAAPGSDVLQGPFPPPQSPPQIPYMPKKQVKFMSKKGSVEFMANDKKFQRKFMKKGCDKKFCGAGCNESDFLASLTRQADGDVHKKWSAFGIKKEDHLIAPEPQQSEPKAGQVGFAPQGRLNQIGGGYTMDDFKDLPTLGESVKYPSFTQWKAKKK